MSYKNLEVWQLASELTIDIHKMSLTELPKFEMYEGGSQIRRSIKSVRSNIAEGYGRKHYQQEYFRFLTFSLASNDETIDHLEILFETGSFTNKALYENIHERLEILGKKLNMMSQTILSSLTKKTNVNSQ